MNTQFLNIKTQDGECDTFLASPIENGPHPGVLLLMDAFGSRDYLYEMTKTLASKGYTVLVPNLFYRVRPAPLLDVQYPLKAEDMPNVRPKLGPLFATFKPADTLRDIGVFLEFLSQNKKLVKQGPIGVTGYCMGGGLAIRTAAQFPDRVAAAASFHSGGLASDATDSPHLLLSKVKAELYIAHADNDQHMQAEEIERLDVALAQANLRYKSELYKGAAHGFTMADLPAYNEAALKRH